MPPKEPDAEPAPTHAPAHAPAVHEVERAAPPRLEPEIVELDDDD